MHGSRRSISVLQLLQASWIFVDIVSGDRLSPVRGKSIIWTNDDVLAYR